jgi:uncharacterized protein YbjT (DUF2867 family)
MRRCSTLGKAKMAFRVLIIGGTGQVGAAVVRALAAEPSCAEVVLVNRRAIALTADPRVRQVILDTADAQFPAEVTRLAQSMVAQGDPVYGASCVGVGKGRADSNLKWSEEELKALEIGVVGGFARGCQAGGITRFSLLSAVGSTAKSRVRYVRVMGLKEETVQGIGFQRLAIFRPGIIAGNAHTPWYVAWLGRLIPGRFGTIEQDDIGRAFVAEFTSSSVPNGVVYLENAAMRQKRSSVPPLSPAGSAAAEARCLMALRASYLVLCPLPHPASHRIGVISNGLSRRRATVLPGCRPEPRESYHTD